MKVGQGDRFPDKLLGECLGKYFEMPGKKNGSAPLCVGSCEGHRNPTSFVVLRALCASVVWIVVSHRSRYQMVADYQHRAHIVQRETHRGHKHSFNQDTKKSQKNLTMRKLLPESHKDPVQNCTSTSTSFAPCRMASNTAFWSFIRKMRHSGVSI